MSDPIIDIVKDSIRSCQRCPLHNDVTAPVPFDVVGNEVEVMVIGEAPGATEDAEGVPFSGASGQLLRRVIRNVGGGDFALMNVICCKPPGNRVPTSNEIVACRDNYFSQITVADPKVMILLGATSLYQWRNDLQISRARGRVGRWGERWVLPTFHPSYVLRNKSVYGDFVRDVDKGFKLIHKKDSSVVNMLPETCVLCGNEVYYYDRDLVAWCKGCWHPSMGVNRYYQGELL